MPRVVTVTYDSVHEFVHVEYLPVIVATRQDAWALAAGIDGEMSKLRRKVDVVVNLGKLVVKAAAVAAYDEARQRLMAAYARRSYSYGGSALVRTRILTSSTLNGQPANVFASYSEAVEAMLADRAREGVKRE